MRSFPLTLTLSHKGREDYVVMYPHPDPLPLGEGTIVDNLSQRERELKTVI